MSYGAKSLEGIIWVLEVFFRSKQKKFTVSEISAKYSRLVSERKINSMTTDWMTTSLFEITIYPDLEVAKAWVNGHWEIQFRRELNEKLKLDHLELQVKLLRAIYTTYRGARYCSSGANRDLQNIQRNFMQVKDNWRCNRTANDGSLEMQHPSQS